MSKFGIIFLAQIRSRKKEQTTAIKGEWIRYGDQQGYLALPERAAQPLPSVIVIQEVMGVNDQIEDVTRRIAAAGFVEAMRKAGKPSRDSFARLLAFYFKALAS